jgi:hypothetical protein
MACAAYVAHALVRRQGSVKRNWIMEQRKGSEAAASGGRDQENAERREPRHLGLELVLVP